MYQNVSKDNHSVYRRVTKESKLVAILNSDCKQKQGNKKKPTYLSDEFCFVLLFCNMAL